MINCALFPFKKQCFILHINYLGTVIFILTTGYSNEKNAAMCSTEHEGLDRRKGYGCLCTVLYWCWNSDS